MSLITRCPACETMFKVVPDQLRISSGWVRCGQCAEIFDAAQHLLPAAGAAPPLTPPPASGPAAAVAPVAPPAPVYPTAHSGASAETPAQAPAPPLPIPRAPDHVAAPPPPQALQGETAQAPWQEAQQRAAATAPTAVGAVAPPDPVPHTPPAAMPAPPFRASAPAPLAEPNFLSAALAQAQPEPEDDAPAEQVSFLRKDDTAAFWRRPLVRILLWLLLAVLVAALGVQFLLHERDRIVQIQPAARPLLLALCAWNGCSLAPLRQIESVVIDSSSFGRVRGDTYRLGVALRNNAPVEIAMPALELTLTDTQDQPLVRRVLLPAEFAASSTRLAAGADWNTALSLSVKAADNATRITGYRLLAFYP